MFIQKIIEAIFDVLQWNMRLQQALPIKRIWGCFSQLFICQIVSMAISNSLIIKHKWFGRKTSLKNQSKVFVLHKFEVVVKIYSSVFILSQIQGCKFMQKIWKIKWQNSTLVRIFVKPTWGHLRTTWGHHEATAVLVSKNWSSLKSIFPSHFLGNGSFFVEGC